MKINELVNKNNEELKSLLKDLKKENFNMRFQKVYGQITNTSRVSQVKKDIARILTILNDKKRNHHA